MRFEVYSDVAGKYRWRLKSGNGQKVATSGEAFASKGNAARAATTFKLSAKTCGYAIYADAAGSYRWRAKARNGETVASSGEAFASQANAQRAADNVRDNASGADGP